MAKGLPCILPLRTHNLWGNMTNNTSNAHIPEWNNLAPVIYTDIFLGVYHVCIRAFPFFSLHLLTFEATDQELAS